MTNEIRHGPVTMHRAIERRLLREITARPADAPRKQSPDDAEPGAPAAAERARSGGAETGTARILRPASGRTGRHEAGGRTQAKPGRPA